MPSLIHEAPLVVLREDPSLVPTLLRESLGLELPPFATAEIADADFTQAVPIERRADLVIQLRGGPPDHAPVLGIIVEVQLHRDDDKRRSWPLYVASLHARLRCPTCLVVIAIDETIARWASRPITTLQLGSSFGPLVIGPDRIPLVTPERARENPWLALLAALPERRGRATKAAAAGVLAAFEVLRKPQRDFCYNLLNASANENVRRLLEDVMLQPEEREAFMRLAVEYQYVIGIRSTLLRLADRHGPLDEMLRRRLFLCEQPDRMLELAAGIANATTTTEMERVLATLPEEPEYDE